MQKVFPYHADIMILANPVESQAAALDIVCGSPV